MDFSDCSNSSEFVEKYLQHLQDETNKAMIPAVVMLVMFAVTGLVGNILVLLVYSQKMRLTPTKVIIMTIASIDLIANVGSIPSEIYSTLNPWTFNNTAACKFKVCLGTITSVGGALLLCVVAVIRFRKVCRPYGWQMTIRQAIIASIITGVLSFIFSIPYLAIFGIKSRQSPCDNIKGHECYVDDHYIKTIWPLVNNAIFLMLYVSLSISMVVMYIMIGITAWKHSRIYGVSGGVAKNDDNSTSASSSAEKRSGSSIEDTPKPQSAENESKNKSSNAFPWDRIRDLFCVKKKANQATAHCTIKKVSASTNETDPGEDSSDSMKADVNFITAEEKDNVLQGAKVSQTYLTVGDNSIRDPTYRPSNEERQGKSPYAAEHGDCMENNQDQEKAALNNQFILNKTFVNNKSASTPKIKVTKEGKRRRPLGRMTAMLIIITAIFVFSYLPFLSLSVYKSQFRKKYDSLNTAEMAIFDLSYKSYFLNSACNAIIYSLCDINFRRECFSLLTFKGRSRT